MDRIRVGILGYGNLGKGVEAGIRQNKDMELTAVITRREPATVSVHSDEVEVFHINELSSLEDKIDVLIMCGGSMTDLPELAPMVAGKFNTVDGFDTHAKIPEYCKSIDEKAKNGNKVSVIASGWDPGLFSLNRLMGTAVLPTGDGSTFWGVGVSQGHSDAIRRIAGVMDARQYTVPIEAAMDKVRRGEGADLQTREKHLRRCYVVAEEGADLVRIEQEIKTMPNYFADYDTEVHFVDMEELKKEHNRLPHGGFVIRNGVTGFENENKELMEFKLNLESNPEFTANVLIAYARAAYKMNQEGMSGAMTVFDIAPKYLSGLSSEELMQLL